MKYIPLEELIVYQQAMEIGEQVWQAVERWDYIPRKSLGCQFCDAADSIAANIAEVYGRYHYGDSRQFYYYARGSLLETKSWMQKAKIATLFRRKSPKICITSFTHVTTRLTAS